MFYLTATFLILATSTITSAASLDVDKRTTCNADNCLRALRANSGPAITYCSAYTTATQTATTGFPTYIPQTCGPSRVSSACSCLATQMPSASPCPTGQVVQNPSFYGYPNEPSIEPWKITHISGTQGCHYHPGSYSQASLDEVSGDPCSVLCDFAGNSGTDTVSQDITLCPGVTYNLKAHVACYPNYDPNTDDYTLGTTFKILFDTQVILPSQFSCQPCNPSDQECGAYYPYYDSYYMPVYGTVVGPASGKGTLKFEISAPQSDHMLYSLLLDSVVLSSA